ncbi:hypothetical protein DOTSEDRAFT_71601 [Dothistroma septosporum NZE10]|uniref:Zn(2)-C6 fungal-type domain-containing protein n=1 Tax=Dothistroma septosporum (strain NZE10 / CBS 128990) TaxID=675120 RepID=N1PKF2_DOTSN|nr:hypothetical protein DOTSEDRAFT_71601 [Dothistroma septosporum NZE10]
MAAESGQSPNGNSSSSSNQQKRQRAKQACEPCRLRKRRCDGNLPCNMCTQFEYKCYFEKHPRKRSKLVEQHALVDGPDSPELIKAELGTAEQHCAEDVSTMRSMEANSGIAFTRLLGQRLDPSSGPKLFTFGWNLGSSTYVPPVAPEVTDYLDQDQMSSLARLYFANVYPLYGFLDRDWIMKNISLRWLQHELCQVPDHLLCGIAAVGALFSSDTAITAALPNLPDIVEAQKKALESVSTMQPATLTDVQSWILRCLYLRATDHPHATWIATCTTMHLIEAVGLQFEVSSSVLHPAANDAQNDPEIRRRAFWVARMLNSWVSFEYGRTRVALRGITAQLPTSREGDYTLDYINLYSISCCLDPETSDKAGQWEDFLDRLDAYEPKHDGIALSKANLGLCGYRRLRLANPNLSTEIINKIINIGLGGLEAASRMAERGLPWWHVANVPFQVICVFLAMDGRESLSHLATAMRTLEFVVEKFHTAAMKEALRTARFLVRLSKKRKDEDSEVLGLSLKKDMVDGDPHPENLKAPQQPLPQVNGTAPVPLEEGPTTVSSNEDWNPDVLNDSQFDWNYFLTHDMPAFNTFAPDGTM